MKKRIGSKLYDTETAELLCSIDGGKLYQKRTRDREYFAVMDDGTIRPLDVYDPLDVALMETGRLPDGSFADPEPREYRVRIDRATYKKIFDAAKVEGVSMSQIVRRCVENMIK